MIFTKLQIALLFVAIVLTAFITYTATHSSTSGQIKELEGKIKVDVFDIKRSQDSLKLISTWIKNLTERNTLLLDSIEVLNTRRKQIETVIHYIHVEPLTSKELEKRFKKRYHYL